MLSTWGVRSGVVSSQGLPIDATHHEPHQCPVDIAVMAEAKAGPRRGFQVGGRLLHRQSLIADEAGGENPDGVKKEEDTGAGRAWETCVQGDFAIDNAQRVVQLTATEYNLVAELSIHAGRVVPYDDLLQRAWG